MSNVAKVFALAVLSTLAGCAMHSQDPSLTAEVIKAKKASDELTLAPSRSVAVEIVSDNKPASGGGVWLGNGRVLTATHIFLGAKSASDPIFVTSRGERVRASVVFYGMPPNFDLLLLKIDQASVPASLAKVPPPQVCGDVEPVGALLNVTAHDGTYSTYASPVGAFMHKGKKWAQSTTALLSHGVSGSPVYDVESGCLAGIVSRLESQWGGSLADPKKVACQKATVQMEDAANGVTCAIEMKTVFVTSDNIRTFLKEAQEYEQSHGSD